MNENETHTHQESQSESRPLRSLSPVAADFMKFFASAGIAGAFLAGFVYTNEYYHSFGLSALEVGVSYFEAAAFGIYLLRDIWVLIAAIICVIFGSLLVVFARLRFGDHGFYLSILFLFPLICILAIWLGDSRAAKHSAKVIHGSSGTIAVCILRDDIEFSADFRDRFREQTRNANVRKVIITDDTIYLSYVHKNWPRGEHGYAYAIKKADVRRCRFFGN